MPHELSAQLASELSDWRDVIRINRVDIGHFCSAFHLYAREKRGFVNYFGGFYENFSNTYFKYKLSKIENLKSSRNSFTGMEIIFL